MTSPYTQAIVCAWCEATMGTKPAESPGVTHSLCEACSLKYFRIQFTLDPQKEQP